VRSKLAITQFSFKKTLIENIVSNQEHKFPYPQMQEVHLAYKDDENKGPRPTKNMKLLSR
jgi:hypothetical protein